MRIRLTRRSCRRWNRLRIQGRGHRPRSNCAANGGSAEREREREDWDKVGAPCPADSAPVVVPAQRRLRPSGGGAPTTGRGVRPSAVGAPVVTRIVRRSPTGRRARSRRLQAIVTKIGYFGTYLRYLPTNPTSHRCDNIPANPSWIPDIFRYLFRISTSSSTVELLYLLGFSSMTPLRNSRISHAPRMLLFDTSKNHF